jgi:hypothetical protein
MCVPCGSAPRERIDLRAVGLRFPLTRLEVRRRSPRAPSVVSRPREPRPTSQTRFGDLFGPLARLRTGSPSLCSCLASGEATNILPASALCAPRSLATSRRPRRAMRPTDVCHPNERSVYPYLVRSWQAPRLAPRAGREEFGLRATRPGKGAFHDAPASLRRVWPGTHSSCAGDLTRLSRPRACSTRGAPGDRASDTPVAPLAASERPEPSLVGTRRSPCSHGTCRSEVIERGAEAAWPALS